MLEHGGATHLPAFYYFNWSWCFLLQKKERAIMNTQLKFEGLTAETKRLTNSPGNLLVGEVLTNLLRIS
jgi:hypothetical protein